MLRLTNSVTRALTAVTFLGTITLAGATYAASNTDSQSVTQVAAVPAKAATRDHVEQRISGLHHKLHISAAQEAQWAVVAQAMRDNAHSMDSLIKERSANAKSMTAVDDLVSYEKLAAAHEDGLKAFIPLFQALYDSMTADQKKIADAAFRGHGPHEKHGRT
jgi:hypothetical protein